MEIKKYVINERTLIQKKLVLGQVMKLLELFEKMDFKASSGETVIQFVTSMGSNFPQLLAIILKEEGRGICSEEEFLEKSKFFEEEMDSDILLEVVTDFFSFVPTTQISMMAEKLKALVGQTGKK